MKTSSWLFLLFLSVSSANNLRRKLSNRNVVLRNAVCAPGRPCHQCQGGCRTDDDCIGQHLGCFHRRSNELVPGCTGTGESGKNYCYVKPKLDYRLKLCSPFQPCNLCEGACEKDDDCDGELKCYRRRRGSQVPGCRGKGARGYNYCYAPDEPTIQQAPPSAEAPNHCGCYQCTEHIWNTRALEHTCGERIDHLMEAGNTEEDACFRIGGREFPEICGGCNPTTCDGRIPPPREKPLPPLHCGCHSCTQTAWETMAGDHSCGARIDWLFKTSRNFASEEMACLQVAKNEFPDICKPCDPSQCENAFFPTLPVDTIDIIPPISIDPPSLPQQSQVVAQDPVVPNDPPQFPLIQVPPISGTPPIVQNTPPQQSQTIQVQQTIQLPFRGFPFTFLAPPQDVASVGCGCKKCTRAIWDTRAGEYTCGERIEWLRDVEHSVPHEEAACIIIGRDEFPDVCGDCDTSSCEKVDNYQPPATSTSSPTPAPEFYCGCTECTPAVWNRFAEDYTCGQRIEHLFKTDPFNYPDQEAACIRIGAGEFPAQCGPCDPITCDGRTRAPAAPPSARGPSDPFCGCQDCTAEIWNRQAGDYTCGERIEYLRDKDGTIRNEEEACLRVANLEFSSMCGPECDPYRCDGRTPAPFVPPPTFAPGPDLVSTTPLYCYPDVGNGRVQYKNVWGNYRVEVKEAGFACGPGDNWFSKDTVSLNGNDLKLEFKYVAGRWTGSEVRVVLPDAKMPFHYGKYSFSVKSVQVLNGNTVVSNMLPSDLVLGMFTWDDTDNYHVHQNWNHEVDVEISRWGKPENDDVQFLVQPPGDPQLSRYSSGGNQGGHTYDFTWNPAEIVWSSTHGKTHTYSSDIQIRQRKLTKDFLQCMPANVEIRINLWNMYGLAPPEGFTSTNYKAVVVFDNFSYTPSGKTHVPNGGACSKHCQCAATSLCISGTCTGS